MSWDETEISGPWASEGISDEIARRFFAKVDASGDCWIWTAHRSSYGYGTFTLPRQSGSWQSIAAHRCAWMILVGPIAPGNVLDHLCRTKACVNPDHLDEVTQRVNVRRGLLVQPKCHRGHPFTPGNTYRAPVDGRRRCRTCQEAARLRRLGARRARSKGSVG